MTKFLNISTDTTLGGNSPSDATVVSQKAVKTYIDNSSGGGSSLPDQTGNAGKFLTTNGTSASWSDKPLVNTATGTSAITILGNGTSKATAMNIGIASYAYATGGIAIGFGAYANQFSVSIGRSAGSAHYGVAIGGSTVVTANYAIQLGYGQTNSVANTFKVGNNNGNYEMMSADGTIPTDRFTTTPSADGTYVPTLNISSGVATRSWSAPSGGSVDIDNSTITKNTDDELQAVATVNANTAVGATNPIYDWVGTLAEYTSQAVATNHPDWVCYITDDLTAGAYDAYSKSQTDALLANKVTTGHEVIAFQAPTAGNNYTWYRKYADGWVEQGGLAAGASNAGVSVSLPVTMADTNYAAFGTSTRSDEAATPQSSFALRTQKQWSSTTSVYFIHTWCTSNNIGYSAAPFYWEVKGMAA